MPSRSSDKAAVHQIGEFLRLLVAALGFLLHGDDALFEAVEIGEHQLGLDRLDVADRIDAAFDMGDVAVLETAHDMGDGVAFADIGEKLVAEPFALGGAAHEAGDVDEGQARRNDLFGAGDPGQFLKPRIGNGDFADIGLDRAERDNSRPAPRRSA